MSELTLRLCVALLGAIFLFTLFAALSHQSKRIGKAAFSMTFCAALFFGCIATASGFQLPWPGGKTADFRQVIIQIPMLTAFLMIFITGGVLRSQRLLIGTVCSYLLFLYFATAVKLQCSFLPETPLRAIIYTTLSGVTEAVNVNAVGNLLAYLTVPMFYSLCSRLKYRIFRIAAALFAAQAVAIIPGTLLKRLNGIPDNTQDVTLWATAISILLMTVLLSSYLRLLGKDVPEHKTGIFDFIFAFFGSYGRIRELEADVTSWENRYHLILHHTAEVVIMSDANGVICEANIAAGKLFAGGRTSTLIGKKLFALFTAEPALSIDDAARGTHYFTCTVSSPRKKQILSASITPIQLKKRLLLVMVARDITAEKELAQEKERLAGQLIHAQRMESLGVLAGGIAHDFNNFIHAILGHADVAMMMCSGNPEKVDSHLRKITAIAEKAGKLTSQLLGFARQGKYNVVDIELSKLLEECSGLLEPMRTHQITIRHDYHDDPVIRGDQLQMQQVIMNLLINALDALEQVPKKVLALSAGKAVDAPLPFNPPPDNADADIKKYIFFAVQDNGEGMDENTRRKIFEPFFTTKPVGKGSGMGLAMVYGTVSHHKGWIELASAPGEGTTFCIFLPAAE